MNALGRASSTMLPRASRHFTGIQTRNAGTKATFRQIWLSDVSTYPIIGILGIAVAGCSFFMTRKITTCPDVRVTKNHKGHVIRSH